MWQILPHLHISDEAARKLLKDRRIPHLEVRAGTARFMRIPARYVRHLEKNEIVRLNTGTLQFFRNKLTAFCQEPATLRLERQLATQYAREFQARQKRGLDEVDYIPVAYLQSFAPDDTKWRAWLHMNAQKDTEVLGHVIPASVLIEVLNWRSTRQA